MEQNGKSTGKAKDVKTPASIFEFPQSSSHTDHKRSEDFGAISSALTGNEQTLYNELMKAARKLDGRHVAGVYAHVANVVEQVSAIKARGGNAIPALARGLDQLKSIGFDQRAKKLKYWRDLTHDGREGPLFALWFMLGSVAALIAGLATDASWLYFSAFLASCSAACLVPTLWEMYTGK